MRLKITNTRIVLFFSLICLLFSCSADVNVLKCEINVKQGNTDIPCETGYFNFGNLPIHSMQLITFFIENTGIDELRLTKPERILILGQNADEFEIMTYNTDSIILPESHTEFAINFKPQSLGNKTATISIPNNDKNENPYTFIVVGNCISPASEIHITQDNNDILCSTGSCNFGTIAVNSSSPNLHFKILNNGTKDLVLSGTPNLISKSGTDADMFFIDQTNTYSPIAGGSSTEFSISFNPTSAGIKTAKISIINNDSDENPYTFTINGTGENKPSIIVKQGTDIIPNTTGKYIFENILIYDLSEVTFTIENQGSSTLQLSDSPHYISISGTFTHMFSFNSSSTDEFISPGNSTTFSITFKPTSPGDKPITVSIPNNDDNANPYTFSIVGNCVAPEINVKQGSTDIPYSTGNYDMGSIIVNNPGKEVEFTIENRGTVNLKLNGSPIIEITGTNANEFLLNTNSTESLILPNNNTSFTIQFKPTSNGSKTATVSIANNDYDENPYIFTIKGEGILCNYLWTKACGGTGIDSGKSIVSDSSGNIYILGDFRNTVNFGAGFGSTDTKTSAGACDFSVTKITSNGGYEWTRCFGGPGEDKGNSIALDNSGNLYLTGYFGVTVNFGADFGLSDSKTSTGYTDAFITKITSSGNYVWTKIIGGSGYDYGNAITVTSSGYIYITGKFNGLVNFGADFSTNNNKTSVGDTDIYLTKLSINGTYYWTKCFGSTGADDSQAITCDTSENIYLTGSFENTINFGLDFSTTDNKTSAGSTDAFVTKINSNGSYGWTKRFGGSNSESADTIITDTSGYIYIAGVYTSSLNFAADFGSSDVKTFNGGHDFFITKISSSGTYEWTKRFGGSSHELVNAINIDSTGRIFLTGYFRGTINFGYDFGTSDSKTPVRFYDIFLTAITTSGGYLWTKCFGGNDEDYGNSIAFDSSNNIYLCGWFEKTVNFGADFSTTDNHISTGMSDIFITKISQ